MINTSGNRTEFVNRNAAECTVLLKKSGQFPIERPGDIAAYGAGVRYTIKGGTGSGEVNSKETFTIEQGLERAGFAIVSKSWLDAYDEVRKQARKKYIKELKAEARSRHENAFIFSMGKVMKEPDHDLAIEKECETAVYVVARNSGEGSDRAVSEGDVRLAKSEIRDILLLNKIYDRFLLVLNVGGALDLSPVAEVKDILLLSQLGTDCGAVLSDILLGRQNPSGKLTTTWAEFGEYSTEGTFGDWNDNRYKEGIYVGYRYFDTFHKTPLFPFGYGLSYTEFKTETAGVEADRDVFTVKVHVRNTGKYAGKEVIQVYLSSPADQLDQPYQQLAAYAKTPLLESGGECELRISFKLSDFASYDEQSEGYVLEKGRYIIRAGNSSVDTVPAAAVTLDETVTTLKTRNCLGKPDFTDIKPENGKDEPVPDDITTFTLTAKDFEQREVSYDKEPEVDPRIKALTDEELAFLQIGNFDPNAKGLGVIGNAAKHLAGAAGETTSQLVSKGIRPLIMADGPAGVRVALRYYEEGGYQYDAENKGMLMDSMLEMMGPVAGFLYKRIMGGKKVPQNAVIKEHSATMIPIGTAIAQSFNTELAEAFGNIVGEEMEEFGVHLWLAPALNIHRSILCGRNFEYYSEDPLVSGETAAAITKGVQKHKGCGTTIKHYAANNAETNRYCNNSQVSERAMREIYLKGFGICVRKSQPKAVMTSYNLLNGTHTSEHRGLIEDVLRAEFGFEGIVMTDWVVDIMNGPDSAYRGARSDEVAKAGGELFMPGTKKDYERVLAALKDGSLSRKQLEINASRLIGMIDGFYEN
ncbi:MAG: glycoside hydrolase family 3 C-terminal domain-containing protein [Lachnospiraceae bacterium]|nr:glycoside hydrolase family 3 C-terminal domain-containing protein [Lachnospiraceae bacterium]